MGKACTETQIRIRFIPEYIIVLGHGEHRHYAHCLPCKLQTEIFRTNPPDQSKYFICIAHMYKEKSSAHDHMRSVFPNMQYLSTRTDTLTSILKSKQIR